MERVAYSADGVAIHYQAAGAGEPALVLVHGWSCDSSYWRLQLDHLAARRMAVVVDLAGHGASGIGRREWTMAAFGHDVRAVVEQLELGQVVLVGHSMGGDVVVDAALAMPHRVVGLVWIDVYGSLGTPRTAGDLEAFVAPFRIDFVAATTDFVRRMFSPGTDPDLVESVAADMAAAPPSVAVPTLVHAVANHAAMPERLSRLDVALVAINPDSGKTDVEDLRRYGIETVLVPGVGHFPMLEDPARFNVLLEEVVERLVV